MEAKAVREQAASYSQFACVGGGFAGIGVGATLKRWYGLSDVRIFERNSTLGGTWHANQYPGKITFPSACSRNSVSPLIRSGSSDADHGAHIGCACDVP